MRVVIIGGTGHIGGYLVPRLVRVGNEVVVLSRHGRPRYRQDSSWAEVRNELVDRDVEEAAGTFGRHVAELGADAIVDLTCFETDSAAQLVEAIRDRDTYLVHCGSIWVHGPSALVPTTEDAPRHPFGHYGEAKAAIEELLLKETHGGGVPSAILHPGHIVGPGWVPLNPAGNFETSVYERLAAGEEVALPNFGLETVHHVHADDVAQAFALALENRQAAAGESFHVTSERAITLRGYCEAVARFFGQTSHLVFLPWDHWRETAGAQAAESTWDHIAHSPSISVEKARRLIGYDPRYTSLEAVFESLSFLMAAGQLAVARPEAPESDAS